MSSTNRSEEIIFLPIPNYSNYLINQYGDVVNKTTYKFLKACERKGYLRVALFNNGKRKYFSVHRLVAENFILNSESKPQINHIDGDKKNNYYKNLEWCDNSENQIHAWENGLQRRTEKHEEQLQRLKIRNKRLTDEQVRYIRKNYEKGKNSYKYFAEMFGVSGKTIELIVKIKRYKEVL